MFRGNRLIKGKHTFITRSRWLTPICISMLAAAIFTQRAALYNQQITLLFAVVTLWAGAAWWIAFDARRYLRLCARIQKQPLLLPGAFLLFALMLLDFFTLFLQDLFPVISLHFFLFGSLNVGLCILFMLMLAARHPRHIIRRATIALGIIGALLLIAEFAFRSWLTAYVVPQNDREFLQRVAAQWRHPVTMVKRPGAFRLIGIGGAFGRAGGDDNFHARLAEHLRQAIPGAEVLNFSLDGYLLPQNVALFTRFGAEYQPDVVLHSIFVGRDFWGDPDVDLRSYRGVPLQQPRSLLAWAPRNFLFRQWMEYRLFSASADENVSYELRWNARERLEICRTDLTPNHAIWSRAAQLLDDIAREAQNYRARYIIVMHPDPFQVEPRILRDMQETYDIPANAYDLGQPQRFLREYCAARGLACLDLLPAFNAQGSAGGLYEADYRQYSDAGNAIAAQAIAQMLTQAGTSALKPLAAPAPMFQLRAVTITNARGETLQPVEDIYALALGETVAISVALEHGAQDEVVAQWRTLNGEIQDTSALTNIYTARKSGADYIVINIHNAATGDALEVPISLTVR